MAAIQVLKPSPLLPQKPVVIIVQGQADIKTNDDVQVVRRK